jgi:hypothetical protein
MPMKYHSGVEVLKGDRVLLSGDQGVIEFVADSLIREPDTIWYIERFGGGVMITQLKNLGSVFIHVPEEDEDLKFVSRPN